MDYMVELFFKNLKQPLSLLIENLCLTHNRPKCLEWNSASEKLEVFFPLKYEILRLEKCLNLSLQRGDIF